MGYREYENEVKIQGLDAEVIKTGDQALLLELDGKDVIHVKVRNGIEIHGTVKTVQMYGGHFRIDGDIE